LVLDRDAENKVGLLLVSGFGSSYDTPDVIPSCVHRLQEYWPPKRIGIMTMPCVEFMK
jgi:hypothetical protein